MIPQPRYLLDRFLPYIVLKVQIAGNHVAAEHEFLPNHNAELVAKNVKVIRFLIPAAPLTHHSHVGRALRFQNLTVAFRSHAVRKTIEWNHVGALRENWNAVHDELEALA